MNKYFTYILLSSVIIINASRRMEEPFVPKIVKESYRPIERNIRINIEGFYAKTSTNISNFFRKFGIL